jgi:Lon protease-like protein
VILKQPWRYDDALNEAMSSFSAWYRNLSDDEKAEQEQRARDPFEEIRRRTTQRPPVEDDWEPPASILRKEPPRR